MTTEMCIIPVVMDDENEIVSLHVVPAKDVAIHIGSTVTYIFWSNNVYMQSSNDIKKAKGQKEVQFINAIVDPEIADIEFFSNSVEAYARVTALKRQLTDAGKLAEVPIRP